jgi:hypothetical protein
MVLRKSYYAVEVLPTYEGWGPSLGRRFRPSAGPRAEGHRLPVDRSTVSLLGTRRMGYPDPIFVEHKVWPRLGGGYEKVEGSEVPLRSEYGGDGRTYENTRHEPPTNA